MFITKTLLVLFINGSVLLINWASFVYSTWHYVSIRTSYNEIQAQLRSDWSKLGAFWVAIIKCNQLVKKSAVRPRYRRASQSEATRLGARAALVCGRTPHHNFLDIPAATGEMRRRYILLLLMTHLIWDILSLWYCATITSTQDKMTRLQFWRDGVTNFRKK